MKHELGYTSHPLFVKALIQVLKEYDVKIIVGDNPPFKDIKSVLKGNGIYKVLQEENIEIAENSKLIHLENNNTLKYKQFDFSESFVNADILINLPKLKTHSFTYFSCAQKNLFGMIYGLTKADWHVKANNPKDFGMLINDIYTTTKSQYQKDHYINLCDAVIGLEGDGPTTGGTSQELGAIICSTSGVAADIVGIKLAGLDLSKSFITTTAIENKIEVQDETDYEVIGDELFTKKFQEPEKTNAGIKLLEKQFMKNLLLEHPVIDHSKCIGCGNCAKICPAKTMIKNEKDKYPHLNKHTCIRCWCCAEVCPVSAISKSNRPILGKLIIKK